MTLKPPNGPTAPGPYSVPNPDPTALTTEAVDRAVSQWREVADRDLLVINTRLNALDEATKLATDKVDQQRHVLRDDVDRAAQSLRELIDSKIKNVYDVTIEKFTGINNQFVERDTRTEQAAQENRISLGAALSAAKEAVAEQNASNAKAIAKSEEATEKQLDGIKALMTTNNKSLEDKISDLQRRLDRGEGAVIGAVTKGAEGREIKQDARGLIGLVLGSLIGLIGVIVAVTVALSG